ncbi:MAG TPA: hypothetical protein VF787_19745, partial [Thermoanaerobaculia bacterium]
MNKASIVVALLVAVSIDAAPRIRAVRGPAPPLPVIEVSAEPAACAMTPLAQDTCDGAASLAASEVDAIVRAAARAINDDTMTIAVVDRAGR